jgi:hypothetical protein
VSVVWKEETAVFVRDRFRVERTALEIDGGQKEVVKAVQDEASPTPLPGEPLKAKNLLLGEGQSLLRAHFSKSTSIFGVLFFWNGSSGPPTNLGVRGWVGCFVR